MKRIFLIVLDSCGVGAAPDSEAFGDIGVNTLRSCAASKKFSIPNLVAAGLGNMDGIDYLPKADHPAAALCLYEYTIIEAPVCPAASTYPPMDVALFACQAGLCPYSNALPLLSNPAHNAACCHPPQDLQ